MGEYELSGERRGDDRDVSDDREDDRHLEELPDGAGCTEIWEHLSERRGEDDDPERVEE